MKNIEINKIRPEYNIIDIRDYSDYIADHIYNAKNIPANELLNNYSKYLNKNKTYYIYCNKGVTSKKVCELLDILGYDVINMYGGYVNYKKIL